jgi:hypothetical protein
MQPITIEQSSIGPGYYFITGHNNVRICGVNPIPEINCLYSDDFVIWALQKNLISHNHITHYLKPSKVLHRNFFTGLIDHIMALFDKHDDRKTILNIIWGYLNKTYAYHCDVKISMSAEDADLYSMSEEYNDVKVLEPDEYVPVFRFIKESMHAVGNHYRTIYAKIRDIEIMNVFNTAEEIGGQIALIQTDCAIMNNPINIPEEHINVLCELKYQEITDYQRKLKISQRNGPLDKGYIPMPPKIMQCEEDTGDYDETLNKILAGESLLITGEAGFGKTYLINKAVGKLKEMGKKVHCMSFTNPAAARISGTTLNKSFNVDVGEEIGTGLSSHLNKADVVIIDEVYLAPALFIKDFRTVAQLGKQIIVAGDPGQLEAIEETWEPINESSLVSFIPKKIILTTTRRYSLDDLKIIRRIRDGLEELPVWDDANGERPIRSLCFYNQTRKNENLKQALKWINRPNAGPHIQIKATKAEYTHDVPISSGMPFLVFSRLIAKKLINGTMGTITAINGDNIDVVVENVDGDVPITITRDEFRHHCVLAFCMTIYKVQGQTFDFPYIVYNLDRIKRIKGGLYTAITRNKKLKNVFTSYHGAIQPQNDTPIIEEPVEINDLD